ncbi:MAG: HAMP domain-containing sensor histidine kinase, partial [Cyanobacteria bacterium P01_G01_bin.49]
QAISSLRIQPWIKKIEKNQEFPIINDLKNNACLEKLSFLKKTSLSSLLAIGTNFQDKNNGIIILGKIESCQWTQQEKNILKEVTDIVAIACHLTELQSQPEESVPYTNTDFSLSSIPKILEKNPLLRLWWETTRKQLDRQLESNKQLIYNMITIMSDQTRNPLAIMKMGITILRQQKLSPKELKKRLDILEKEWDKLNEINEKILKLKNLKSHLLTLSPHLLNLETLINKIIHNSQSEWEKTQQKSLALQADFSELNQTSTNILTDEEQLTKILQELLKNAGKFAVDHSKILLKISGDFESSQPNIIISISNVSPCNFVTNIDQFFDPFYREQMVIDTAIPGIGLGLTIVKDLVELLNGRIKPFSNPHDTPEYCKITFELTLPQSL